MHIVGGALSNPGVIGAAVLTVAGNTLAIALPAVAVHYLCRSGIGSERVRVAAFRGGLAKGLAILMTVALALTLSGRHDLIAAKLVSFAHLPIMVIGAVLCAAAVALIRQVRPELFGVFGLPIPRRRDA